MSKQTRKKLNQRKQQLLNELKSRLLQVDNDEPITLESDALFGLISEGTIKSNVSQGWQMVRITGVKQ